MAFTSGNIPVCFYCLGNTDKCGEPADQSGWVLHKLKDKGCWLQPVFISNLGDRRMALGGNCLLCEHSDLCSNPQDPVKVWHGGPSLEPQCWV